MEGWMEGVGEWRREERIDDRKKSEWREGGYEDRGRNVVEGKN